MSRSPQQNQKLILGSAICGFVLLLLWNVILTVSSSQRHQALSTEIADLKAGMENELVLALVDADGTPTADVVRTAPAVSVVNATPITTSSPAPAVDVDPADAILGAFAPPPRGSIIEPMPSGSEFGTGRDLLASKQPSLFELTVQTVQRNKIVGLNGGKQSGVKKGMFFTIAGNSGTIAKLEIQSVSDVASVGMVSELQNGQSIKVGDRLTPGN